MAKSTRKKNTQPNRKISLVERFIQEFLSTIQPGERGWDSILTELDSLIQQYVDEQKQSMKINIVDDSLSQLFSRFSGKVSAGEEIDIFLWAGHHYENFGDWDKAQEAYQRVITLSETNISEFHEQKAEALRWIGFLLTMQNKWPEALKYFLESLNLCITNL